MSLPSLISSFWNVISALVKSNCDDSKVHFSDAHSVPGQYLFVSVLFNLTKYRKKAHR